RRLPDGVGADGRTANACRQRCQRLLQLGAGERGAEAVMGSMAEGEVWNLRILNWRDLVCLGESAVVAVGAPQREQQRGAGLEGVSVAFDRGGDGTSDAGDR